MQTLVVSYDQLVTVGIFTGDELSRQLITVEQYKNDEYLLSNIYNFVSSFDIGSAFFGIKAALSKEDVPGSLRLGAIETNSDYIYSYINLKDLRRLMDLSLKLNLKEFYLNDYLEMYNQVQVEENDVIILDEYGNDFMAIHKLGEYIVDFKLIKANNIRRELTEFQNSNYCNNKYFFGNNIHGARVDHSEWLNNFNYINDEKAARLEPIFTVLLSTSLKINEKVLAKLEATINNVVEEELPKTGTDGMVRNNITSNRRGPARKTETPSKPVDNKKSKKESKRDKKKDKKKEKNSSRENRQSRNNRSTVENKSANNSNNNRVSVKQDRVPQDNKDDKLTKGQTWLLIGVFAMCLLAVIVVVVFFI